MEDDHHHQLPKFKSNPPPSLISPSSYQRALSDLLLDSPVLFSNSNLVASPTTGAFGGEAGLFNFNSDEFTFQLPRPLLPEAAANSEYQEDGNNREQKIKTTSDGYRWRKYGQKQVKGSENPRSYYKCTYPNCPTKKKVETCLEDGHITEIVYKGAHTHPKPHSTTTNSNVSQSDVSNQSPPSRMDDDSTSVSTQQDFEGVMSGHRRPSIANNNYDEDHDIQTQPSYHPKRWKGGDAEYNNNNKASDSKTVREPRVVVQTFSEIDILDDGYRWRKYGQKVVKGNPNPRSYYKCTYIGCPVRKHVERAAQDMRAVITTYEGKHNHDIPVGRGGNALHNHNAAAPHPPPIRPTAIPTTTSTHNQGLVVFQQTNTKQEPTHTSFFASFLS